MEDTYIGIPRLSWEAEHEWDARKSFLDSNKEFYTGDRLASLSMAWSNWMFMGCSYSPIQDILEECHSRLPAEVEENIKRLLDAATPKVKFVKASQGENLGTRTGPPQGKKEHFSN